MPKISVIVPVYNAEKYLHRCIDSILAQTFTDFELLLIDDGSKDSSGAICDKYAKKDARVRVFHKENGGVSSARNVGIIKSKGEYLMFSDSDDFMRSEMCDIMYKYITTKLSDIVICGTEETGGGVWQPWEEIDYNTNELAKAYPTLPRPGLLAPPWNKIYKRCLVTILFDERTSFGEDFIFNLKYLENCKKISFVKDCPMFHSKDNPESLSSIVCLNRLSEIELYFNSVVEFCSRYHTANSLSLKYFNDLSIYIRKLLVDNTIKYSIKKNILSDWHKNAAIQKLNINSSKICFKNKLLIFYIKHRLWRLAYIQINKKII